MKTAMTNRLDTHQEYTATVVMTLLVCLTIVLTISVSSESQAQNLFAEPAYGTASLSAGFDPDPQVKSISAGGSNSFDSCTGYFSADPDMNLDYQGGEYDLSIFAKADVDTTLAINQPDGSWLCSDDSEFLNGGNPGVMIDNPASGIYNIWVGVYSESDQFESASLLISEQSTSSWDGLNLAENIFSADELDISASPNFGSVTLVSGFEPDPNSREILAGGSSSSNQCTGYYSTSPDLNLDYTAGDYDLAILSRADGDTTLLVNDAQGNWHCNDDSEVLGDSNAAVLITNPPSGLYNIWVGTFSDDEALELQSNLMITETAESYWPTLGLEEVIEAQEVIQEEETTSRQIVDTLTETISEVVPSAVQFGRKNN